MTSAADTGYRSADTEQVSFDDDLIDVGQDERVDRRARCSRSRLDVLPTIRTARRVPPSSWTLGVRVVVVSAPAAALAPVASATEPDRAPECLDSRRRTD